MGITTIQISEKTRNKLLKEKLHEKESYEDVIVRILNQRIEELEDDLLTGKDIEDINKSLKEIKEGNYVTQDELVKKHNL